MDKELQRLLENAGINPLKEGNGKIFDNAEAQVELMVQTLEEMLDSYKMSKDGNYLAEDIEDLLLLIHNSTVR